MKYWSVVGNGTHVMYRLLPAFTKPYDNGEPRGFTMAFVNVDSGLRFVVNQDAEPSNPSVPFEALKELYEDISRRMETGS